MEAASAHRRPDSSFRDVDRSDDPRELVAYLDDMTALDFVQRYKRQTFASMGVTAGDAVLDVGCGAGEDLLLLAALVGSSGRVVGVDSSSVMVGEARTRTLGQPVECQVGDAHQLAFEPNAFDSCRADRVFQHLEQPAVALSELVRVVRPGGRVVVADPDWDTLVVDASDLSLTRRILRCRADRVRNPWMGRQLRALFLLAALDDVSVQTIVSVITNLELGDRINGLRQTIADAVARGLMSSSEADSWLGDQEQRSAAGHFFLAMAGFIVSGRKPLS